MTLARTRTAILALAALLTAAPLAGAGATPTTPAPPAPAAVAPTTAADGAATDRLVVKFREDAVPEDSRDAVYTEAAARSVGAGTGLAEAAATVDGAKVLRTAGTLDTAELDALTTALEQDPAVEYAEPDLLAGTAAEPSDPAYRARQWSLWDDPAGLGLPLAWDRATGAGQTIAIVDTGITAHPDLDANRLPGYDFVSTAEYGRDGDGWDADPSDMGDHPDAALCPGSPMPATSSWHGTHTAGIAAAVGDNGIGVTGVAPDAKVLPVRVVGACSQGYVSDVAAGIAWAAGARVPGAPVNPRPATVINLSLGLQAQCPPVLQAAISDAVARGSVVVAAAGNMGVDAAQSAPANCAGVVSVAATNVSGALASYSNFGSVTVAAPGGDPWAPIHSTGNAGAKGPGAPSYVDRSGTSMAAPAVAGTVALIREASPGLGVDGVRAALTGTARKAPGGCAPGCGAGVVDPVSAVITAQGGRPFTTRNAIGALHRKLSASTGAPRSREICALEGTPCFQQFQVGWIVWSRAGGTRWIPGELPAQWWTLAAAR